MKENKSNRIGTSTPGLLGVAFVVLKLTNIIDWSWWWVTAPFWGAGLLSVLVVVIAATIEYKNQDKVK